MPARLECRELVDAFCHVLRTGCAWRRLPKSFPHWFTVYKSFSRWAAKGAFEACETVCASSGAGGWIGMRNPAPRCSTRNPRASCLRGGESGVDACKKVKGPVSVKRSDSRDRELVCAFATLAGAA